MRSQTYFLKNRQLEDSNRKLLVYQEAHSNYLAQPKRSVPKFSGNTMALSASTKRRTTFTDKLWAIQNQEKEI